MSAIDYGANYVDMHGQVWTGLGGAEASNGKGVTLRASDPKKLTELIDQYAELHPPPSKWLSVVPFTGQYDDENLLWQVPVLGVLAYFLYRKLRA